MSTKLHTKTSSVYLIRPSGFESDKEVHGNEGTVGIFKAAEVSNGQATVCESPIKTAIDELHSALETKPTVRFFSTNGHLKVNVSLPHAALTAINPTLSLSHQDDEKKICRSLVNDMLMMCALVVLVILQFAVFDYFFVEYGHRRRGETLKELIEDHMDCNHTLQLLDKVVHSYEYIYYWIVPDLVAVGAMAMLPILLIHQRLKPHFSEKEQCRNALTNVRFAAISWLIYAIVFDAKIYVSSRTLVVRLQKINFCAGELFFNTENHFIFLLCASAVIFLALILGHHAHTKEANEILHSMTEIVTFDVLDGIHFLEIIFSERAVVYLYKNPGMQDFIVTLTSINILLPALSLFKIFHKLSETDKDHRKTKFWQLLSDQSNAVFGLVFINIPYLIIRCFFWYQMQVELSIFLLKNAIMLVVQGRQVRIIAYRLWRMKQKVHLDQDHGQAYPSDWIGPKPQSRRPTRALLSVDNDVLAESGHARPSKNSTVGELTLACQNGTSLRPQQLDCRSLSAAGITETSGVRSRSVLTKVNDLDDE